MTTRGHHGLLFAGVAAGGFPTYLSNTATDLGGADATSHLVNMPAVVSSGDLLIALIAVDGNPTITTPSGWTFLQQSNVTTIVKGAVYYKVAAGTEGGTTVDFATGTSERMMAQVVRIQAGTYSGTPESAVANTASSVNPDPPNLTPSWGALNTLWIAMSSMDNTRTVSVYPLANNQVRTANASTGTAYVTLATCSTNNSGSSLNPGTFTINIASDSVNFTIAVRPT